MSNLSNWTNGIEGERDQGDMKDTNRDLQVGDPTYECRMKGLQTLGCYSEVTNLGEAASSYMQASQQGSAKESTHSNVSLGKESHMCEQVRANNDIRLERHDSCVNNLANSSFGGMEGPLQNVEPDQGDAGILGGGSGQAGGPAGGQAGGPASLQASDYQNGLMNDHPGSHTNDRGVNPGEAEPPVEGQQSVELNKNNLHDGQNEELGNQTSSHLPIEEEQADGHSKWSLQEEHSKITNEKITEPVQKENEDSKRVHSSHVNDYTFFGQREREAVEVECMRNEPVKGETLLGEDPRGDYCDAGNANLLPPLQEDPNELISSVNQYEHAQVNTFSSDSKQTHGEGEEEMRPTSKDNSNDEIANKLTSPSPEEEKKGNFQHRGEAK
ncbi:transcription factor [Plasmodium cynomolgi strain B]|uniref:Transcription factor n=1 Tax=Plasmodium cynomolgi (strain B) TaxID=1120755 RepID=K6UKC6_PLACD|nr:transcription factor [Plasmodium cynomolgi strain B]GAB66703.1 transcription factor [Plasmodium cynomolgi strain B]